MGDFVDLLDLRVYVNHVFICCGTTVEFDRQYR